VAGVPMAFCYVEEDRRLKTAITQLLHFLVTNAVPPTKLFYKLFLHANFDHRSCISFLGTALY
jgi:hypothetical protein